MWERRGAASAKRAREDLLLRDHCRPKAPARSHSRSPSLARFAD